MAEKRIKIYKPKEPKQEKLNKVKAQRNRKYQEVSSTSNPLTFIYQLLQ